MLKQCGTCRFALGFDYPPDGPGGETDGVKCSSEDMVEQQERLTGMTGDLAMDFQRDGYILLWRLEVLAEETFECPFWKEREEQQS